MAVRRATGVVIEVDGDVAHVPLTRDKRAIIDVEDVDRVGRHLWSYHSPHRKGRKKEYAQGWVSVHGKKEKLYLHRFIMDAPKGVEVDHKNHNGLDCRKSNLRLVTDAQQMYNARPRFNKKSRFKGLTPTKSGKWLAAINHNNVRHHVGVFVSEEEAAKAYDAKARELFGEFAYLNFPDKECE